MATAAKTPTRRRRAFELCLPPDRQFLPDRGGRAPRLFFALPHEAQAGLERGHRKDRAHQLAIAFISLMWQPLHVIGHRFEQHIRVNRHSPPVFVDDLGWPVEIDRQVSLTFVKLRLADRHGQKAV